MSGIGNVAAGMAALGIGFGLGGWRAARTNPDNVAPTKEKTPITFLGSPRPERKTKAGSALPTQFETFREAEPRLAELIEDYQNLTPYERYQTPVVGERLLQEMERYLSLANEADLIAWIKKLDLSEETMSVYAAALGILANRSPSVAAQTLVERGGFKEHHFHPLRTLVRVWESKDSHALERWIAGLPDEIQQKAARQSFLSVKAATDPNLVFSKIDEIDPANGFDTASTLGEALDLAHCPDAATRFLGLRQQANGKPEMLSSFLGSWASRDGEAMMSWLFAQNLEEIGPEIVQRSLYSQVAKDPESVIEVLTPLLAEQPAFNRTAGQAWWAWISTEGQEENAVAWLRENSASASGFGSWQIADHFANEEDWTPERTSRVLTALKSLPPSESLATFSQDFLERLSRYQGKAVAEFAVDFLPLGSKSDSTMAQAVGNWAETEPEAAVRWSLENLESAGARLEAIRFSFAKWVDEDPNAAANLALSLPPKERDSAFEGLDRWAEIDPAEAVAFLKSTPDAVAVSSMTYGTFRFLSEHRSGAEHLPEALAMPPGRMRHDAMRGLFGGWALSDADAGAAALEKVPQGTLRDAAIQGFNGFTIRGNPKLAIDLATRISVAATRDKELISRGRYWLGRDRAAAEAAIRAHPGIPDAVKAEIFK